ncbi:septum site-determining protein MinC [Deinococcus lacus]|uniref:Septum site-determining protein MinC n=1 Tax=Deinococcus lacus TaxID=392561 RepID=A0ABW1YDI4_9DEIO
MKFRSTHGGLYVLIEPGDQAQGVRAALQGRDLAGLHVTAEIQGDADPDALQAALTEIRAAGGLLGRVRAPRVTVNAPAAAPLPPEPAAPQTLIVPGSLRSGFRQECPGSAVILGDVNPGAEVIAGGDIIVVGALRGVAHAGAHGNEAAVVWARPILSAQLRIAGALARSPESSSMGTMRRLAEPARAEIARLRNGSIAIDLAETPPAPGERAGN